MRIHKCSKGSITLEAALILPFFIAFVILLICMIKLSSMQIALQTAVSETTKLVATSIYPVSKGYNAIQSGLDEIGSFQDTLSSSPVDTIPLGQLTSEIDSLITDDLLADLKPGNIIATEIIKHFADESVLDKGDLKVEVIEFDFPSQGDGNIILEGAYTFDLPVPFLNKEITLKARSAERMWL
jgi:hypothetical protein